VQAEMSVVFAVRTVPERSRALAETLESLREGEVLVTVDEGLRGVTWTAARVLALALATDAEWVCVLPDDLVYCRDFPAVVEELSSRTAQAVLVLYSQAAPRGRVVEAHGELVLRARRADQLLAVPLMRRRAAEVFRAELAHRAEAGARRDFDGVGARLAYEQGWPSAVVWPNLVDHRLDLPSALGNPPTVCGRPRWSAWFPGPGWRPDLGGDSRRS